MHCIGARRRGSEATIILIEHYISAIPGSAQPLGSISRRLGINEHSDNKVCREDKGSVCSCILTGIVLGIRGVITARSEFKTR